VVEFLGHRQPQRAAGNGVGRFPAVATVVGTSDACFMPLGPSLARALPACALFEVVQLRDCEVSGGGGLWSEGQLGDVNGGVILGVGSTECRQGEVVGNKVPGSPFELCQWSFWTDCDLISWWNNILFEVEGLEDK
jgi:hypothetical protein